jgi:hypothetical protein
VHPWKLLKSFLEAKRYEQLSSKSLNDIVNFLRWRSSAPSFDLSQDLIDEKNVSDRPAGTEDI